MLRLRSFFFFPPSLCCPLTYPLSLSLLHCKIFPLLLTLRRYKIFHSACKRFGQTWLWANVTELTRWMTPSRITGGDGNQLSRHLSVFDRLRNLEEAHKSSGICDWALKDFGSHEDNKEKVNSKLSENLYTSQGSLDWSIDQVKKITPCYWYQNKGGFTGR